MKLQKFEIEGYRRIYKAEVNFGDATFLIGENNVGKSSVLKALEIFFSETSSMEDEDYFFDEDLNIKADKVVFCATFIDLPEQSLQWRGFKGRVFQEVCDGKPTLSISYRKTYQAGKVKREMRTYEKALKAEYIGCKKINEFIAAGANAVEFDEIFDGVDKTTNIVKKDLEKLELVSDLWDVNEESEKWDENPGGIEGNISIRLPKYLLIPAEDRRSELDDASGTLQKTMKELFDEVREASDNYREAQRYLNLLAEELDPNDENKEFGRMMNDINEIISDIFKESKIHVQTQLNEPKTAIKPTFSISMSSNVKTKPVRQGTGSIRSAVFALLRYRQQFLERRRTEDDNIRTLIIGFEEPEMYLHPNVANLMRDKIYELATSSHTKIVCTTHSPYMIDLSKKIESESYPTQVLNLVKFAKEDETKASTVSIIAFNTTKAYKELVEDDKQYVKFILKVDDYVAKVFFARHIIIVEGDTEDIIFRETIKRMPEQIRTVVMSDIQIIKARGKAAIIPLVKYFKAMGITPLVMHDNDIIEGATKFNQPILDALDGDDTKRVLIMNCIEDVLGNTVNSNGKPYCAFKHINENWGEDWEGVQSNWKDIVINQLLPSYFLE